MTGDVILDADPPADSVRQLPVAADPRRAVAGASNGDASGIEEGGLTGEPGPDGLPPAGAAIVEGRLLNPLDPDADKVAAQLPVPTVKEAKFDVSVLYHGASMPAGRVRHSTRRCNSRLNCGDGDARGGRRGEGSQGQPNVPVILRDIMGVPKMVERTRTASTSSARSRRERTGSPRRRPPTSHAARPPEVLPGQAKKDVDIILKR